LYDGGRHDWYGVHNERDLGERHQRRSLCLSVYALPFILIILINSIISIMSINLIILIISIMSLNLIILINLIIRIILIMSFNLIIPILDGACRSACRIVVDSEPAPDAITPSRFVADPPCHGGIPSLLH